MKPQDAIDHIYNMFLKFAPYAGASKIHIADQEALDNLIASNDKFPKKGKYYQFGIDNPDNYILYETHDGFNYNDNETVVFGTDFLHLKDDSFIFCRKYINYDGSFERLVAWFFNSAAGICYSANIHTKNEDNNFANVCGLFHMAIRDLLIGEIYEQTLGPK